MAGQSTTSLALSTDHSNESGLLRKRRTRLGGTAHQLATPHFHSRWDVASCLASSAGESGQWDDPVTAGNPHSNPTSRTTAP